MRSFKRRDRDIVGRRPGRIESEIGVIDTQAKEHQGLMPPPEAKKRQGKILPRVSETELPANTLPLAV